MTTVATKPTRAEAAPVRRPQLVTRPLVVRFISVVGAEVSFYLPLSVLPLYVKSTGSQAGAGLATGSLLLATVVAELATPRLIRHAGYRLSLAVGLFLLGAPALVLLARPGLPLVIAVSAARGVGFAITTVAGGALTASLLPAERRGEGLGLVGVVVGVPALACLPAGVWAASRWGYQPVFATTAAAALLVLGSLPWLPGRRPERPSDRQPAVGVVARLRQPPLSRLAAVFAASTVAAGVLVTFVPLAVTTTSATMALLAQPATATVAQWVSGRVGDRYGHTRLLRPALLLCATGMACLGATHTPVLVVGGAACFGAGFGVLQNATLAEMYATSQTEAYSVVSAIWNAAYDAGMGAGAAGIGLLAVHAGYPAAFFTTAALTLPALALASRSPGRRLKKSRHASGPTATSRV